MTSQGVWQDPCVLVSNLHVLDGTALDMRNWKCATSGKNKSACYPVLIVWNWGKTLLDQLYCTTYVLLFCKQSLNIKYSFNACDCMRRSANTGHLCIKHPNNQGQIKLFIVLLKEQSTLKYFNTVFLYILNLKYILDFRFEPSTAHHQLVLNWNISRFTGLIDRKIGAHVHGHQERNPDSIGDPLTFSLLSIVSWMDCHEIRASRLTQDELR